MSINDITQIRVRLEALEAAVEAIDAERSDLTLKLLALHGDRLSVDGLLAGTWDVESNTSLTDSIFKGWRFDDDTNGNNVKGSSKGNLLYSALVTAPAENRFGILASIPCYDGTIDFTFNFGEIEFYFTNLTEEEVLQFFKEQNMFIRVDSIVDERKELERTSSELGAIISSLTENGTARMGPDWIDFESDKVEVMGGSFGYEEPEIFDGSFGGRQTQPKFPYPVFHDTNIYAPLQDIMNDSPPDGGGAEDAIYNNIQDEDVDVGMAGCAYWNMINALRVNMRDIGNDPNMPLGLKERMVALQEQAVNCITEFEKTWMKNEKE